jgi:hypothetical protein
MLQAQVDRKTIQPTTFFTIGSEDDCVDAFVEQLRYVRLPAFLAANGLAGEVFYRLLHWPGAETGRAVLGAEDIETHFLDIRAQLHGALGVKLSSNTTLLESKLAASPVCCFFHINIGLDQWGPGQRDLLRRWLAWWLAMDCSSVIHPVVSVVSVVYQKARLSWLGGPRGLGTMRHDVRQLKADGELGIGVHLLPELGSVRFEDVEQWIREHVDHVDREVLKRSVLRHFSGLLTRKALSMYEAANAVKSELNHLQSRAGIA